MKKHSILILVTAALLGVGLWYLTKTKDTGKDLNFEGVAKDRRILKDQNAGDVDTYEALNRLARGQDQQALSSALEKANSNSRMVREGVANALGYFIDDKAFEALKVLLQDPEQNVRIRTLQGLGNAKENRRIELIQKHLNQEGLPDREKVIGNAVLLKLATQEKERQYSIKFLADFAKNGDGDVQYMAFSKLTELAPSDEATLALVRNKVEAGNNPNVVSLGVRHLATVKDKWLVSKLPMLLKNKNEAIRSAAVLSLHQYCLPDSWKILNEKFYTDKSELVINSVVQEASKLGGLKAKDFLTKAIPSGILKGTSRAGAEQFLKSVIIPSATCPKL